MSVTDGSLTTDYAQQTVRVVGTVTAAPSGTQAVSGTVTANQGTAGTAAQGWFTRITDGTDSAAVTSTGQFITTTGVETATTTLTAQSATGAGAVANFGASKQSITLAVTASAGVSAGVVALEVSQDSTSWFITNGSALAAPGVTATTVTGAWRYARGNVTTTITGGTVTATVMAAG